MAKIVVIGAGIGGLTAALSLAKDHEVLVVEADERPGGKAAEVVIDGVPCDTGPSVLTLPEIFEQIFSDIGERFSDHVRLIEHSPAFTYVWPDQQRLDVHQHLDATLESVQSTFGQNAAEDLRAFMNYAGAIWDAASPPFIYGPAPDVWRVLRMLPTHMAQLGTIDPLRSMRRGIEHYVSNPRVRMVLERYATYNGSDVRAAPATLNCIAHVELALGGYGVDGGIHALVRAIESLAKSHGVTFEYGAPVQSLRTQSGHVTGVTLRDGRAIDADAVVCNADVAHLVTDLLPSGTRHGLHMPPRSMSGWTALVRTHRGPHTPHTVAFPDDYSAEFADIFDGSRPPRDPTVYACDPASAHNRPIWPDGSRPVFLMANAPAVQDGQPEQDYAQLRERALQRAAAAGLIGVEDPVVWERSPKLLEARFPRTGGALYGGASNDPLAAFRRPPNRVNRLNGLYLASGSAHPGGGLPLCAMSGKQAALALQRDIGVAK